MALWGVSFPSASIVLYNEDRERKRKEEKEEEERKGRKGVGEDDTLKECMYTERCMYTSSGPAVGAGGLCYY